jgi:hypothetical protein
MELIESCSDLSSLTRYLILNPGIVSELLRRIDGLPLKTQFVSSNWYEIYCVLTLRMEVGTYDPWSSLAGASIKEFFTTKGSLVETDIRGLEPVRSIRKASAMVEVLKCMLGAQYCEVPNEEFFASAEGLGDEYID